MAADIQRLRTRPERANDQAALALRQLLDFAPDLISERLASRVKLELDQREPSNAGWRFVQMSATANRMVVRWLRQHSARPMVAAELWAACLERIRHETGEVMATRDELAVEVGVSAVEVSRLMGELVSIDVIIRRREKVPGMRGPGPVRYFINPNAATRLGGKARDDAQAATPMLRLVSDTAAG
jgi:CRP-like cAMP-binding protein